jgi:hypothetical protein
MIHAGQVWLDHDVAAGCVQPFDVRACATAITVVAEVIPLRVETAGADAGLDHITTRPRRLSPGLPRRQPSGRNDGQAAVGQATQVTLVGVPPDDIGWVGQCGDALGRGKELLPAPRVGL